MLEVHARVIQTAMGLAGLGLAIGCVKASGRFTSMLQDSELQNKPQSDWVSTGYKTLKVAVFAIGMLGLATGTMVFGLSIYFGLQAFSVHALILADLAGAAGIGSTIWLLYHVSTDVLSLYSKL